MAKFAVHLNVLAYVEADSWAEADQKIYETPLSHYVDGVDVIYDVETHGVEQVVEEEV